MGDEMDQCEYILAHEHAMRRLLSMMRQGQTYCTDTECIDEPAQLLNAGRSECDEETSFTMMTMFMMLALILYFVRPNFLMKLTNTKKSDGGRHPPGQDPDGDASPPAVH